jgi:hypothetical protein
MGIHVPYPASDVFNAMDTYPEDAPGVVGGDGEIRFLDWQVALYRSLGFEQEIWARAWIAPGELTNWITAGPGSGTSPLSTTVTRKSKEPKAESTAAPGNIWLRQAAFGFLPPQVLIPGATVDVPIYVNVARGFSLSGLQFRASVVPENGAPSATGVMFTPASAIPSPSLNVPSNFLPSGTGPGWPLNSFNPALTGSNLLGYLQFTVPANAVRGQSYSFHFSYEDGAPNLQTEYNLEGISAISGVLAPSTLPVSMTSDEWKTNFFGSTTNALASDLADPDGDGAPNWQEYLAGTDPTDRKSILALAVQNISGTQLLTWLSATTKNYYIEANSTLAATNWATIGGPIVGDGTAKMFQVPSTGGKTEFFRIHLQP